jgi:bacteriocin biosynthesis cyclodehydratase domain-containing protein
MVWRSPRELQFGVDRPTAVLSRPSVAEERMLAALARGTTRTVLEAIATSSFGRAEDADRLLGRLGDVVESTVAEGARSGPGDAGSARRHVAIDGDGPAANELASLLGRLGIPTRAVRGAQPGVAVVIADYVFEPARYGHWLRRDIPHLPIAFSDRQVSVGPMIEPGSGPCLFCLDLARTDEDPAWPAMATQLLTRAAPTAEPLATAWAVGRAARLVRDRLAISSVPARGRVTANVLDAETGRVSLREHAPHPRCGCRGLPGIATAPRDDDGPTRPTSSAAAAASPG